MYNLVDFVTKKVVKPNKFVFTGENSPWEIQMDLATIKTKLNLDYFKMATPCLSKYLAFMPVRNVAQVIMLIVLKDKKLQHLR
jgi:threonine synthase